MLKLRGAFEENQTLETTKLRYYINKDLETEVGVVGFHCFVSVRHRCQTVCSSACPISKHTRKVVNSKQFLNIF